MFCYACAKEIAEGESFCRSCGAETILSSSAGVPVGLIALTGWFTAGTLAYAFLLLAVIAIVTLFFPQAVSPQLTLLLLAISGVIAAGTAGVMFAKNRKGRLRGLPATDRAYDRPIPDDGVLGLPDQRDAAVPASVVESTTSKLHIPRTPSSQD
ncbi:MAG TPA: hypothetical protein PKD26_04010 [Pyrinomonadaceae bacterium]|nr:hypothetical protein [Pyrinomonadaceae bacterium]